MARFHTLSCPDCGNQKQVAAPSKTHFSCCESWNVTVELVRVGMLMDVVETWKRVEREELPNCVWRGAETPFADNH
jgi:hypothetical protein